MSPKNKGQSKQQQNRQEIVDRNRNDGIRIVSNHPIFCELHKATLWHDNKLAPREGWAVVTANGAVYLNPYRLGTPEEWAYVYAHCLLHLAFGHFKTEKVQQTEWNVACDCYIAKFLADLKFGTPPPELEGILIDLQRYGFSSIRSEERLFAEFCLKGIPAALLPTGTAGSNPIDMVYEPVIAPEWGGRIPDWQNDFAIGLARAVKTTVDTVGDALGSKTSTTEALRARKWFISSYPLLGALAASFEIIEDAEVCRRMQISVAAVNMERMEIYINPHALLSQMELRFVMAHELLHVGLRHDVRCRGRDFYYWNVACDYVINQWLVEMNIGTLPRLGVLYDPTLKGESAEAVYDRIVNDLRQYRKVATLRGVNLSDMLGEPGWQGSARGQELDDFYRNCLAQGLRYHQEQGRGFLSADLIEEIQALSHPPIPWDVELAQWFDCYFRPVEKVRTYARLSRRQSSTPDIPRPQWTVEQPDENRTFGVLIDTSGSIDQTLLGRALGAIASYSISRDVHQVRVVFCDAAVYDQGYLTPEEIAGKVKVRGRGGTILQPGINLLEKAKDFPAKGPLLIITDGQCDSLRIQRDHAFLLPEARSLPFKPIGPVFSMH